MSQIGGRGGILYLNMITSQIELISSAKWASPDSEFKFLFIEKFTILQSQMGDA